METSINIKGQVLIPAKIRQRLGLKKGNRIFVEERNGEIVLKPMNREYFQKMSGILKGSHLTKALGKSRREDLMHEEKKIGAKSFR